MKLITLNLWGGRITKELFDFLKKYSDAGVDIFLFQEVFHNATDKTAWVETVRRELFSEISEALPEYAGHFAPAESGEWGLASFVKKNISVEEVGDIFVHAKKDSMIGRDGSTLGKNLQYIKIASDKNSDKTPLTVINFHGLWNGNGKTDTPDRINQSKRIIEFIKFLPGEVILAGDFNLRPDTESIRLLEQELNLKNLIAEHGITSTRTSLYSKSEKFADYVFVSSGIQMKDFRVLPEEVSDHAALYLEF